MKLLEERILKDGRVITGNILKVDSFLNHQIDVKLLSAMGEEWKRLFADTEITKILTIEASGIGIACIAAEHFDVPVVFAKKSKSSNIGSDLYSSKVESYTHGRVYDVIVSNRYLSADDKILIIDDFLANGNALKALIDIANQAGASVAGIGIAIEKEYQGGGNKIREMGYRIESLAKISSMDGEGRIVFC